MNINQIGITILAVGSIIISGCAGDGSYSSTKNDKMGSPLIEFGDTGSQLVRPTHGAFSAASKALNKQSQSVDQNRWTSQCVNRCRYEAALAKKRCYEDNTPDCSNEANDVFETCTTYECGDGSAVDNNASPFDHHSPVVEETQASEEELDDPILACQEACGAFGTKTYLKCINDTDGLAPIRCRNNADEVTHQCVVTHCPTDA
ncbi:MAG TPA: hypothetical protein EYN06_03515 [Myxococcales bacterium]|nr:hypothetical protein [Myxococcales bacterium]HIN85526.1 hypothetical protein [Myxococcales bacterium]